MDYEEIKMLRERRLDYHVSIERGLMKKVHAAKVPPFLNRQGDELERWVDIEPGETAKREEEDKDETRRKAMDAISSGNQVATQRIKDLMQSTEKAGRSPEEPFAA